MSSSDNHNKKSPLWRISLAALGIVFGDIGTSPLYAFRECFTGAHAAPVDPANMIGAASLILWSIVFVVTFKYVFLVLRLNYKGEGGILALSVLVRGSRLAAGLPDKKWIYGIGLLGAALIYADGMITPAISVLSAVEGLNVLSPDMHPYVVPVALMIIVALFVIQRHGTGKVGSFFGPIILLWFLTLGFLGLYWIAQCPSVLFALNPTRGLMFLVHEWQHAVPLLSAVFLALTGAEALYADLGHFGRKPISIAWFYIVFPCLIFNYMGQAALLTLHPQTVNTFYSMVPASAVLPLTLLATAAAVIASQALISGAYSLTTQAIQLGCIPRLRVLYTSTTEKGQVYLPMINWMLMLACILLIITQKSSSNLFPAYGIAISMTMTVTSILFLQAATTVLGWSKGKAIFIASCFLTVDLAFLYANSLKIAHGGWLPLAFAALLIFIMSTWRWGRERISKRMEKQLLPAQILIDDLQKRPLHRVSGTGFYLCGKSGGIPLALLHNLKHNQVLHERVILLHVETLDSSHAVPEEQCEIHPLGMGLHLMQLRFGFAETPNVPLALREHLVGEVRYEPNKSTFFLGRETYALGRNINAWGRFRIAIFAWMTRNATPASAYFSLPPSRVVELGAQVTL